MCKKAVRTIVHKIADLIPRRFRREVPKEPKPTLYVGRTALEEKLGREIQKRQAREAVRAVDTRQGSPNMPRYQPCPRGHGMKRRKQKTAGGANYRCSTCGEFFVRARR